MIGAISGMLLAEDGAEALLEKLAEPAIRIVSLTITEGGYCSGEFLAELPLVRHDLANPRTPRGSSAFSARLCGGAAHAGVHRDVLRQPPHNGEVARKALLAFAAARPGLACWIATHVSFPNAMVDRITPMTSPPTAANWPNGTAWKTPGRWSANPSCNGCWKDRFSAGRPAWEKVGVQFTDDVTPYEEMKIGLLNGSHLALTWASCAAASSTKPSATRCCATCGPSWTATWPRCWHRYRGSTWSATRTAWSSASPTAPSPTNWNGSARTARRSFPSSSSPPPIG